MSWAAQRKFLIMLIVGAVLVAFLAVILIAVLYKPSSCADGIQNQDEAGIDCGGTCPYLCTSQVQSPTILFTKLLQTEPGRTDVIASVRNNNVTAAAKNVRYKITLYGSEKSFDKEINGTIDLPPGVTQPIYIPGVSSGEKQKIISAFLEIDPSAPKWFIMTSDTRNVPTVGNTTVAGSVGAPLVQAVLTNNGAKALSNLKVIVFVNNAKKDVIAASETIVPTIPPQGQATASFTWNKAFSNSPATIEVVPIIPLP